MCGIIEAGQNLPFAGRERLQSLERVGVFPHQPDQGGSLLVRLAPSRVPLLERAGVHTKFEREHVVRLPERLARPADDVCVDWWNRDRLHLSCLQSEPPFAVIPHSFHTRHELPEEAALLSNHRSLLRCHSSFPS